ncbi:MAG: GyrI-like domain-containing protein [Candidatus Marinimicrobia bacterium]|nr:GyrI-like domain-containing protein [Candidatus Neomarinimicrobiota bacterium]MCF7840750.1 GyrI-like domain-containing protein [Candidatus Neomarinimicrobiota bacterium]MCF7902758.1 GyrI-like domain-containing protein [Candidatus Neomarinimicrobiota bacterium]
MNISEISLRVKRFAIFLAILILLILSLAWFLGAFKRVDLKMDQQPEIIMAGQWLHTSYREILDYTESQLFPMVNNDSPNVTGVCGLYFDNPKLVVADSLEAFVGVMLTDSSSIPEGLIYRRVLSGPALHGRFERSPIIGQFKIYPAAGRWLEQRGMSVAGPVLEIYHRQESHKWVDYYFPVEHHED